MKLKTTIRESVVALLALVLIVGVAYAGSLTPSTSTVTPQSYTLSDLYNKVTNINYSATSHTVSTTSSPASSFYTLTDIYGKLSENVGFAVPGNIRDGVTILGVRGNYTGTGGTTHTLDWTRTFPTLTIVNGVEVWQAGMVHNGLCWDTQSYYAMEGGCNTRLIPRWNGDMIGGFYEANPNVGPNGQNSIPLGAVEYCDYLNLNGLTVATTPQHYWRLPTLEELYFKATQAIFNGEDDPATQSRGGFRNLATSYPSSEVSNITFRKDIPPGMHDMVKVVGFTYRPSSSSIAAAPGDATMQTRFGFRCVHQN